MELKLVEQLSVVTWERALMDLPLGAEILQSPIWQQVSEEEGYKVHLFAWEKDGHLMALAQVLESENFFGRFWYIPRGPVFFNDGHDVGGGKVWETIRKDLEKKAKERGVIVIRHEPSNLEPSDLHIDLGKRIKAIQPEKTCLLDLSLDDKQLLSQMHQKTRYNIRLAEKRGVKIEPGNLDDVNLFYNLLQLTTQRDGFRAHSLEHYRRLFLDSQDKVELWLAKKDGELLAAGMFSFYGRRATYLHGASANHGRQHMTPYLLQWQVIKRAKDLDCLIYDFYGIDEHKWPGVTRFKLGFSSWKKEYPGTFILVLNAHRYFLYKVAAYSRRLLKL